jgi:hypothetical protein
LLLVEEKGLVLLILAFLLALPTGAWEGAWLVFWMKVTALVLNTEGCAVIITAALFSTATIRVSRLFHGR